MTGTSLIDRLSNNLFPRRDDLFQPFEQYFNKIYDEFFQGDYGSGIKSRVGYPKIDVLTENGKYIVEVAAPGTNAEDITVEIVPCDSGIGNFGIQEPNQRVLKISGKMSEERQRSPQANYQVKELRRSSFERTLLLPECIEGDPEASMKEGILSLVWEYPEAKTPERKVIPIKKLD